MRARVYCARAFLAQRMPTIVAGPRQCHHPSAAGLLLLFLQNRTAAARAGIYTILFHSGRLPALVSLKAQDADLRYVTSKGTSYLAGDCEIYNETETTRTVLDAYRWIVLSFPIYFIFFERRE